MSTLIPEHQWDKLRQMTAEQIKGKHGCEILNGSEYMFTLIPANTTDYIIADNIRTQSEYLAVRANSAMPPEKVLTFVGFTCPDCSFVAISKFGLRAHQRHCKSRVKV